MEYSIGIASLAFVAAVALLTGRRFHVRVGRAELRVDVPSPNVKRPKQLCRRSANRS